VGTVFKKTFTKPVPAGAETFTRKGQSYSTWKDRKGRKRTARLTTSKDGKPRILVESAVYVAQYKGGDGRPVVVPTGCRDETAARRVLAELERQAELVRAGVLRADEVRLGEHQGRPLAEHFTAFDAHLAAKGDSPRHRADTLGYLQTLARECPFATLADLRRESLERWLLAKAEAGLSARSRNAYRTALVTFGNWCVESRRLPANPFVGLPKANEKADRRRQRRALEEHELVLLLDATRRRPLVDASTINRGPKKGQPGARPAEATRRRLERLGRERALLYKTLVLTGLRRGELASLTAAHLHLDGAIPFLTLHAGDEKSREGSDVPLRDDLAADLRGWLAEKLRDLQEEARRRGEPIPALLPSDTPVFRVPVKLVKILERDLVLAGLARRVKVRGKWVVDKRDGRGRTLDVHALRTTFGTLLSKGGVAPRTAQAALRHSDINLTMNVYTDPKLLDVRGALNALPELPLDGRTALPANTAEK
jgi:integrase